MSRKKKLYKKTVYKTRAVNNILNIYRGAELTNMENWYLGASKFAMELSNEFNVDYLKVCGIISALSPLKSWNENKRIARLFISKGIGKHTRQQNNKAKSILTNPQTLGLESSILEILGGEKIKSFFHNIAFPLESTKVTIDRHAISIILNRSIRSEEGKLTKPQYQFLAECYIEASEILGVLPSTVQAVTWERWRELKKVN